MNENIDNITDKKIEKFEDVLVKNREGIMKMALRGLNRLITNQNFTETEDNISIKKTWVDTDWQQNFISYITQDLSFIVRTDKKEDTVKVGLIQRAFQQYCQETGGYKPKRVNMRQELCKLGFSTYIKDGYPVVRGFKMRNDEVSF